MSEHEEMKANRPAVAVLCLAGILLAISITSVLLVPGLQPRYVAAPPPGTGPSGLGGPGPQALPGAQVLIIGVNNTLVMKNADTADHTLTSNPGDTFSFDTGDISGLSSSSPIVFTTPGVYPYHCQFHPAYMHGTITVLASGSSSSSSSTTST